MSKKLITIVAVAGLTLTASIPAVAQMEDFTVTPADEPVSTCEWGPTEVATPENPYAPNASDPFDHVPGEFVVSYYDSEGIQLLRFDDIASIPDPCDRFAAEEAKRQEILASPGVRDATYNSLMPEALGE
jgi:hypothetical protein